VIVGTSGFGGELDARAKQLADSSDAVHWLGHVRDDQLLFALWRECTVYFHGHSVGGTNPALVQAMACGAAVVARDTPYNREVLEDSGVFCDPDSEHIADTIRLLVESPERRTQLSIAAVARAKTEYTWERVNQDYEQALIDLL
jgi:glycosyltransferase involved in cell wall biosynthesis